MHRISFDKAADGTSFAKVAFTVDDWELFDSADQSMVDERPRADAQLPNR